MAMTGGTAKLVASGTPPGWGVPISLYVYYREKQQDIGTNTTVLSLGMYVSIPTGYYIGPWSDFRGSYVGTAASGDNCKTFDGKVPANTRGEVWLVEDQDVTVIHDNDGKKTATVFWMWGVHSGWSGVMNYPAGSFSVPLTTIPRASDLDSVSCSTKYFTGTLTYKYTPKSPAYYNRCDIDLNRDGSMTLIKRIDLGCGNASQQTGEEKLSDEELAVIYRALPDAAAGTLRLTLRTYSDAEYAAQVGDASYREISLSVPDDSTTKPAVTMQLTSESSLPEAFAGLYIQGKSKVRAALSAEAKYGAEVVSLRLKAEGKEYGPEQQYTSDYLNNPGQITVTGSATDNRGCTGTAEETLTVIAYSAPKLLPASGESEVVAARCDAQGDLTESGTYLKIKAGCRYAPVMDGETQKNFCRIRFRYRQAAAESWSEWETVLQCGADGIQEISTGPLMNGALSEKITYQVQVQAIDDIGDDSYTTIIIPTDSIHTHKTRNGMGLGKYCEGENLLDVAWDVHFRGDVLIGETGMTLREYILSVIGEGG